MTSRDTILNKLRAARAESRVDTALLNSVPPRPARYLPVTVVDDLSQDGLIGRFSTEFVRLMGEIFIVEGEDAARAQVLALLAEHQTKRLIAWDFAHIPISGLADAIRADGIDSIHPETHDEFRAETLSAAESAQVGLTGVDAAVAATGSLIVTTAPGKGRIPTVLAPVHIAVVLLDQLLPRLEDWVAKLRAENMGTIRNHANFCVISGPSRTGDIEMELILGVHGPGRVQVVLVK
ncbi:MAG: lactate utilization protein [Chloroflexota bacterium]|nr:lactate utilization protein [Chloroflexota bacterium]